MSRVIRYGHGSELGRTEKEKKGGRQSENLEKEKSVKKLFEKL